MKLTPKQLLVMELNRHTGGNGAFIYELLEAAVGMTIAEYNGDRISKTEAERIYGPSTIKELESSPIEGLFFRNSGSRNSKKFYSRKAIDEAISKMGWPMSQDPIRRKRTRYVRKKKEAK